MRGRRRPLTGQTTNMIVVIDANSLMADPMCAGAVWQVLAHAPTSWDLQLVTTEAAVAEAVAGYGREIAKALTAWDKASKSWGRLGAHAAGEAARAELSAKQKDYPRNFAGSLRDAGVEIVPVATVPHMQVVERAVQGADLATTTGTGTATRCFGSPCCNWRPRRTSRSL